MRSNSSRTAWRTLRVERRQRFVEQQHLRAPYQRARQRHTLRLAAADLAWHPRAERRKPDHGQRLVDTQAQLVRRRPHAAARGETEGDVVANVQVREERVTLEDDVERPLLRRRMRDVAPVEQHLALIGRLKAGENTEQRGLAAAARSEQAEERARVDVQVDVAERGDAAKTFRNADNVDRTVWRGFGCRSAAHSAAFAPASNPRPRPMKGAAISNASHGITRSSVATALIEGSMLRWRRE